MPDRRNRYGPTAPTDTAEEYFTTPWWTAATEAPDDPDEGDMWYDTDDNKVYIWVE